MTISACLNSSKMCGNASGMIPMPLGAPGQDGRSGINCGEFIVHRFTMPCHTFRAEADRIGS
jgi:hypothetical protein